MIFVKTMWTISVGVCARVSRIFVAHSMAIIASVRALFVELVAVLAELRSSWHAEIQEDKLALGRGQKRYS